MKVSVSLSGKL